MFFGTGFRMENLQKKGHPGFIGAATKSAGHLYSHGFFMSNQIGGTPLRVSEHITPCGG